MRYSLILQGALGIAISISTCIFSSTAQAHSLCKTLGERLDPFKQCSHTHFTGRTVVPSSIGYFDNGATVFYTDGKFYCGFVSPNHHQFFKAVNSAKSLGRRNPKDFGTYTGVCDLPSGYFNNGATTFYSAGNGTFCGFPNPQSYDSHGRSRSQLPRFGRIDIEPKRFMEYTGVCK